MARLLTSGLLALAMIKLAACATSEHNVAKAEREAAIARWVDCLDREMTRVNGLLEADSAAALEAGLPSVDQRCEGHRRDVIDSFPSHQRQQVGRLLDERRQRRVVGQMQNIAFEPFPSLH